MDGVLVGSHFRRDGFTWLTYFLLAFYAYSLNVLGPITPFLKAELQLSYTVSSLHFTAFALGMLLVGLGGHAVISRLGRWRSLWLGAVGMAVGALFLFVGKSAVITIAAAFLMDLIGSLILAIVPSALAEQHGEHRAIPLTEANVVASVASAAAPLLVGWFAPMVWGWRLVLVVVAAAPIFLYVILGRSRPVPVATSGVTLLPGTTPLPRRYWLFWFAMVLGVAVEFCLISWSADYMEKVMGLNKAAAAQSVSLFLVAMILGRLTMSRLVHRFQPANLVIAAVVTAGVGFLLYWLGRMAVLGLMGLFVAGLGVAGLYPLILTLALAAAGSQTVQASARATLASGTAILILPLTLGRLADAVGIQQAYGIVIVLLAALLGLMLISRRLN